MDDAFFVRRGQAARDLDARTRRPCGRQGAAPPALAQRLALEQLRHDVRRAAHAADVVHREDVGMIERRGRPRFLLEAVQADRRRRRTTPAGP